MSDADKIKLLFISSDKFPPFRVDVAVLFGRELVRRGHKIDWLLQSEKDCSNFHQTEWQTCKIWVGATDNGASRWQRLKKHFLNIRNDMKMFELVRQNNYDFIQVKDKFISALLAIIAAKKNKTKFIYWLSYPFPEASLHRAKDGTARYPFFYRLRGHFFSFLLYAIILPKADHVFVQSTKMKEDVETMGIPSSKLMPVPMGISLENIPYHPEKLHKPHNKGELIVLYLGTLAKVRKMDFLLRVFALVKKQISEAKLYLVGGGDDPTDEDLLHNESARLKIADSVIFTGFIPMKEAWNYVKKADVCVSPFFPTPILNSTSPTKLIEYMAMGKAVVANDHPEQRLVLTESGAGHCVPYEETAFAEAVIDLLRHPKKAMEIGLKGRHYVTQHRSYEVMADMVEKKYIQIINSADTR